MESSRYVIGITPIGIGIGIRIGIGIGLGNKFPSLFVQHRCRHQYVTVVSRAD